MNMIHSIDDYKKLHFKTLNEATIPFHSCINAIELSTLLSAPKVEKKC
jgi:hypothetical protein